MKGLIVAMHPQVRRVCALAMASALALGIASCSSDNDEPTGQEHKQNHNTTATSSENRASGESTSPHSPSSTKDHPKPAEPEPTVGNQNHQDAAPEEPAAPLPPAPPAGHQESEEAQGRHADVPKKKDVGYNCRNRVAPPLNSAQLPIAGGGAFHYTVKDNRFDPCTHLSWIEIRGDYQGPREGVLFYLNGDPVNSPQPLLMQEVTAVQRLNGSTVKITYRTPRGVGAVTYFATPDGVREIANTLPAGASQNAVRLAGAQS